MSYQCPECARDIEDDDLDFCYPLRRERDLWRAGCNTHDGGCGFEVIKPSEHEVLQPFVCKQVSS